MATVFSANRGSVTIDGEAIEGVQTLAYQVVTEREDIRALGSDERVGVSFGLRKVVGEIAVRSTAALIDRLLDTRDRFQIVVQFSREGDADIAVYCFDDCYAENKAFQVDAGGTGLTTYGFTAVRCRQVEAKKE